MLLTLMPLKCLKRLWILKLPNAVQTETIPCEKSRVNRMKHKLNLSIQWDVMNVIILSRISVIQVFEFHSAGNDYEMITCHYWDSMLHRKMVYRENVRKCRHFIDWKCYFDKDDCWFIHDTPVAISYQNSKL